MAERLKDLFFAPSFIDKLMAALEQAYSAFDEKKFRSLVYDSAWEGKELLARMHHLCLF